MAKYVCFPVVEPPSSGGFDGCIASLLILFAIGGLIVAGFNHLFGLDKNNYTNQPNKNVSSQSQNVPSQSQNSSANHTQQHVQYSEKHHYRSAHRMKEADLQQPHHNHIRVSAYTSNSDASSDNGLHGSIYDAISHSERNSVRAQSSANTSGGDLHSNNEIGTSPSEDYGSKSSSSSDDISGGLH